MSNQQKYIVVKALKGEFVRPNELGDGMPLTYGIRDKRSGIVLAGEGVYIKTESGYKAISPVLYDLPTESWPEAVGFVLPFVRGYIAIYKLKNDYSLIYSLVSLLNKQDNEVVNVLAIFCNEGQITVPRPEGAISFWCSIGGTRYENPEVCQLNKGDYAVAVFKVQEEFVEGVAGLVDFCRYDGLAFVAPLYYGPNVTVVNLLDDWALLKAKAIEPYQSKLQSTSEFNLQIPLKFEIDPYTGVCVRNFIGYLIYPRKVQGEMKGAAYPVLCGDIEIGFTPDGKSFYQAADICFAYEPFTGIYEIPFIGKLYEEVTFDDEGNTARIKTRVIRITMPGVKVYYEGVYSIQFESGIVFDGYYTHTGFERVDYTIDGQTWYEQTPGQYGVIPAIAYHAVYTNMLGRKVCVLQRLSKLIINDSLLQRILQNLYLTKPEDMLLYALRCSSSFGAAYWYCTFVFPEGLRFEPGDVFGTEFETIISLIDPGTPTIPYTEISTNVEEFYSESFKGKNEFKKITKGYIIAAAYTPHGVGGLAVCSGTSCIDKSALLGYLAVEGVITGSRTDDIVGLIITDGVNRWLLIAGGYIFSPRCKSFIVIPKPFEAGIYNPYTNKLYMTFKDNRGEVYIYDLVTGKFDVIDTRVGVSIKGFTVLPSGGVVFVGDVNPSTSLGVVGVLNPDGTVVDLSKDAQFINEGIRSVIVVPRGLVLAGDKGTIKFYDGKKFYNVPRPSANAVVKSFAFNPITDELYALVSEGGLNKIYAAYISSIPALSWRIVDIGEEPISMTTTDEGQLIVGLRRGVIAICTPTNGRFECEFIELPFKYDVTSVAYQPYP